MKFLAASLSLFLATVVTGPLSARAFAPASITSSGHHSYYSSLIGRTAPRGLGAEADKSSTATESTVSAADSSDSNPLGLTEELITLTTAFESIGDDKLRYKQLLYMANMLAHIDPAYQIDANKVPGCLSTVHVHARAAPDPTTGATVIHYTGDSDGLLTKGLVALLIRGLSGNTAAAIQKVDPAFIKKAGIDQSLTPGRNNGFLNMLAVMKNKAVELQSVVVADDSSKSASTAVSSEPTSDSPKYDAIVAALTSKLQPASLELKDNSHNHASHLAAGDAIETHFAVDIVAEAFAGISLIKRHQLVYQTLGELMPTIHALQIQAMTPAEVEARKS
jgi:sulfur transfer protein SufE/stress-induced morphogen